VDVFGPEPLFVYELREAIDDGMLVPLRQYAVQTDISIDEVKVRAGDFIERDLARVVAVETRNQTIVDSYRRYLAGRQTLVFAVNLDHVEQLRRSFVGSGVPAALVTGKMKLPERRQVLTDFRDGRYQVLVGCEVLTEGYDERSISGIILARPTQSLTLYQQALGRGLRVHPDMGKTDLVVLDIQDRTTLHEVITASRLFGADVPDCQGRDVRVVADEDRHHRQVYPLSPTRKQQARWDSGEDTRWGEHPDLQGYEPSGRWTQEPATEKQITALARSGMKVHRELTKGEANYLLRECYRLDRKYPTPPTAAQRGYLFSQHLWRPGLTKREAMGLIASTMNRAG
jgi:superfamily II DNA or RNA helicase